MEAGKQSSRYFACSMRGHGLESEQRARRILPSFGDLEMSSNSQTKLATGVKDAECKACTQQDDCRGCWAVTIYRPLVSCRLRERPQSS